MTLVLVTHDPTVAARADRLITVKDGEVVADERLQRVERERIEGGDAGMTAALILVALVSLPFIAILVRRPVLRRLALRNAVRRPREAALVVLGSLLGAAIITGSAVVGDTMDASIRQVARTHLGPIDELVTTRESPPNRRSSSGCFGRSSRATSTASSRSPRSRPRSPAPGPASARRRAHSSCRSTSSRRDAFGGDAEATGISGLHAGGRSSRDHRRRRSRARSRCGRTDRRARVRQPDDARRRPRPAAPRRRRVLARPRAGGAQRARLAEDVRRHPSRRRRRTPPTWRIAVSNRGGVESGAPLTDDVSARIRCCCGRRRASTRRSTR